MTAEQFESILKAQNLAYLIETSCKVCSRPVPIGTGICDSCSYWAISFKINAFSKTYTIKEKRK